MKNWIDKHDIHFHIYVYFFIIIVKNIDEKKTVLLAKCKWVFGKIWQKERPAGNCLIVYWAKVTFFYQQLVLPVWMKKILNTRRILNKEVAKKYKTWISWFFLIFIFFLWNFSRTSRGVDVSWNDSQKVLWKSTPRVPTRSLILNYLN
jgi:hypothetical protein